MGFTWTDDQKKVIGARNNNILVSAAAGSGKTAVLSERIVRRIVEDGISIDEMLIMTFTHAAAAEMKEKIKNAMEKRVRELEEENSDTVAGNIDFLKEQIALVPIANISTIHTFCLSVIHDHVYLTDLEPDFRIANEGEITLLEQDILEGLIEENYETGNEKFLHLVETLRQGASDSALEETILKVYDFAMAYPDMDKWINDIKDMYKIETVADLEEKPWMKELMQSIQLEIDSVIDACNDTIIAAKAAPEPMDCIVEILESEYEQLKSLKDCKTFSDMCKNAKSLSWSRFTFPRKYQDLEYKEYIKELHDKYKAAIEGSNNKDGIKGRFMYEDMDSVVQILKESAVDISVLLDIVSEFTRRFNHEKRRLNIIDFTDMEHIAHDVLKDEEVRAEYRTHFKEILIDEYQDTSYIQEDILKSIAVNEAGKRNLFMVGDVKQSIYAFRNCKPDIFVDKYESYNKNSDEGVLINLRQNFRSRDEVLQSANKVFHSCMKKEVGGVEYTNDVELNLGAKYDDIKDQNFKTSVSLIELPAKNSGDDVQTDDTNKMLEARLIANKIREMIASEFKVKDGDVVRPCKYSDFAILLATRQGWVDDFQSVLNEYNIPTKTTKTTGYYDSLEVQTVLNYLKVLDNPYQDIPLAAVLTSPLGDFTPDEMSEIRVSNKKVMFCEAFNEYSNVGQNPILVRKVNDLKENFEKYRAMLIDMPLYKVIYFIIRETGYDYYVAALPNGDKRKANLDVLIEEAVNFEQTSYQGLFYFLRYLKRLKDFAVDKGEAESGESLADAVLISTIHQSKGLEYPIVFVPELTKKKKHDTGKVRLHSKYGIAMKVLSNDNKVLHKTMLYEMIDRQNTLEETGESLRVLYVAMTRAKEKLFLIGSKRASAAASSDDSDNILKSWANQTLINGSMSLIDIENIGCYADMIMPTVIHDNGELFEYEIVPIIDIQKSDVAANLTRQSIVQNYRNFKGLHAGEIIEDSESLKTLKFSDTFVYPYSNKSSMKPKISVSYIKEKVIDEKLESGELKTPLYHETALNDYMEDSSATADMIDGVPVGALIGTAYHALMENLDYNHCNSESEVIAQIEALTDRGIIDKRVVHKLDAAKVLPFVQSDFGKRARIALENNLLFREQPFMMSIPASAAYGDAASADDTILIQGIIDFYMEEPDGLVLLDYKTDNVDNTDELVLRYKTQLDYYKDALERGTGKRVKETYIYSFKFREFILVE